jgi:DNA-binding GntR family transcriptional regulator
MTTTDRDQTVKNRIYSKLKAEIILGHRSPGQRLTINDLTKEAGTSITPVRDALQMLGQEGLVTIKPRAGYYVSRITLKELRDLLDMRGILEVAAVERAAKVITEDQLEELKHVHAGYTGDDDQAYTRYTEENQRFHYLLAKASGNQELAEAVGRIHERLARFMVMRQAGKKLQSIHDILIDRLSVRDITGAKKAMVEELRNSRTAILEKIVQEEAGHWHVGTAK